MKILIQQVPNLQASSIPGEGLQIEFVNELYTPLIQICYVYCFVLSSRPLHMTTAFPLSSGHP